METWARSWRVSILKNSFAQIFTNSQVCKCRKSQNHNAEEFINMTVEEITYNWHQVGAANDPHGMGEEYQKFTVGQNGVASITEHQDAKGVIKATPFWPTVNF